MSTQKAAKKKVLTSGYGLRLSAEQTGDIIDLRIEVFGVQHDAQDVFPIDWPTLTKCYGQHEDFGGTTYVDSVPACPVAKSIMEQLQALPAGWTMPSVDWRHHRRALITALAMLSV